MKRKHSDNVVLTRKHNVRAIIVFNTSEITKNQAWVFEFNVE